MDSKCPMCSYRYNTGGASYVGPLRDNLHWIIEEARRIKEHATLHGRG